MAADQISPAELGTVLRISRDMLRELQHKLKADPRGAAIAFALARAVGSLDVALEHLRDV